jgi:predicted MFS family arabinose efflux permease
MVPRLIDRARSGLALSIVGSAQNLTLVVLPPLSLAVLGRATNLDGVAMMVAVIVVAGMGLSLTVGRRRFTRRTPMPGLDSTAPGVESSLPEPELEPARRRLGVAYRSSWTIPLAVILFYVAHWGAVTAYLPARAEAAGADVGLFFAADGLAILLMRVPTGHLTDRIRGRWLILTGLAIGLVAVALLLPTPTTPILLLSGFLGGAGGALVLTPILVGLSRRSGERDRGSAFSMFSGSLAAAITLGSIGGAPVIAVGGFEATMVAGLALIVVAALISLRDPGFAAAPGNRR